MFSKTLAPGLGFFQRKPAHLEFQWRVHILFAMLQKGCSIGDFFQLQQELQVCSKCSKGCLLPRRANKV